MFWSVLSWFWLSWSHYFSWSLFFLNSSPLQYGISFNYKLTRTSWWGPLWENNRLLPTSPPKKSDPLPPAVGKKTLNHFKNENQNLLPGMETNTESLQNSKRNFLLSSKIQTDAWHHTSNTALINSITNPWNWNVEQNILACVVRSTLSPPAAKRMFGH